MLREHPVLYLLANDNVVSLSLCAPVHCELLGKVVSSFITRSFHSSYADEDCDSLALCDPLQKMNYEVDSLPESCFDSGLSTLRDNECDSEVDYKHQGEFQTLHRTEESLGGDASDTDVSQNP